MQSTNGAVHSVDQSQVVIDMRLFEATTLGDDVALEHAVGVFEEQLQNSADIALFLSSFVAPCLVEFLISGMFKISK